MRNEPTQTKAARHAEHVADYFGSYEQIAHELRFAMGYGEPQNVKQEQPMRVMRIGQMARNFSR